MLLFNFVLFILSLVAFYVVLRLVGRGHLHSRYASSWFLLLAFSVVFILLNMALYLIRPEFNFIQQLVVFNSIFCVIFVIRAVLAELAYTRLERNYRAIVRSYGDLAMRVKKLEEQNK